MSCTQRRACGSGHATITPCAWERRSSNSGARSIFLGLAIVAFCGGGVGLGHLYVYHISSSTSTATATRNGTTWARRCCSWCAGWGKRLWAREAGGGGRGKQATSIRPSNQHAPSKPATTTSLLLGHGRRHHHHNAEALLNQQASCCQHGRDGADAPIAPVPLLPLTTIIGRVRLGTAEKGASSPPPSMLKTSSTKPQRQTFSL